MFGHQTFEVWKPVKRILATVTVNQKWRSLWLTGMFLFVWTQKYFLLGGYAGFKCSMTKQYQTRSCFYEKSPRLDATDGIDFTTVIILKQQNSRDSAPLTDDQSVYFVSYLISWRFISHYSWLISTEFHVVSFIKAIHKFIYAQQRQQNVRSLSSLSEIDVKEVHLFLLKPMTTLHKMSAFNQLSYNTSRLEILEALLRTPGYIIL